MTQEHFVGLAISGGGSRSANFAAAIMEELDRYGFLKHVNAISAVSGGTVPAAYYALNRSRLDWTKLRRLLVTNFQTKLAKKYLNPLRWYDKLSRHTRSDVMADVFDDIFFHGATFDDLGTDCPELLINATDIVGGQRWVFSRRKDVTQNMDTHLKDGISISRAVAASAAVPFFLNSLAFPYSSGQSTYCRHLVDGGLTDNLGIEALLQMYGDSIHPCAPGARTSPAPKCFIFLIDSFPDMGSPFLQSNPWERPYFRGPHRSLYGAYDILMASARDRFIRSVTGKHPLEIEWPIYDLTYHHHGISITCKVWHFYFRFLYGHGIRNSNPEHNNFRAQLRTLLPAIKTRWRLVARSAACCDSAIQDALYDGAQILVREDHEMRKQALEWFERHGFTLTAASTQPQPIESDYEFFRNNEALAIRNPEGDQIGWCFRQKP